MISSTDTREISLQILLDVIEKDVFLHVELRKALDACSYLERTKKAFIRRLCTGTVEKLIYLDYVIDSFSSVPVKKQKPLIRTILRMSLYQIIFMDSVPDSAACNEAVKLTKKHGFSRLSGFVNGVLRSAARGYKDIKTDEATSLSMPIEIYSCIKEQYPENYIDIFEAFNNHSQKGTIIRLNRSRIKGEDAGSYLKRINAQAVCQELDVYRLSGIDGVESVEGFADGYFSVQDTSAAISSFLASPAEGELCLDMCAAPGGKTIQLLNLSDDKIRVVSRDISEYKLSLVLEAIDRCGFKSCDVQLKDASVFYGEDVDKYDIVIADVPCSGLGIIGTKPDIKHHFSMQGTDELIVLQRKIMENAIRYVKPGGRLIYSTCTLNKKENEENVLWLVGEYGLEFEDISEKIPKCFDSVIDRGMVTLLPKTGINEGFFAAVIRKDDDIRRG